MILPTGATVAVADGETVRLFHKTGMKLGVHLVEPAAAPPAPPTQARVRAIQWAIYKVRR